MPSLFRRSNDVRYAAFYGATRILSVMSTTGEAIKRKAAQIEAIAQPPSR